MNSRDQDFDGMRLAALILIVSPLAVVILLMIFTCGCASSKTTSTTAGAVTPNASGIVITLPWIPNYLTNADGSLMFSNEVTEIVYSIDLNASLVILPVSFIGR